jgi:hypothetical protein
MIRIWISVVVAALCSVAPASATTYPPVAFDDLVARADVIFVGEVTDVRPYTVDTREGTVIKTRVVFRVFDPLHGTGAPLEVLDFFGGEFGGIGMAIEGMPRFAVGDRRVVFARRERSINPIVGFTQGLLQVRRDASGVERILTLDGMPVASTDAIATRAPLLSAAPVVPMRLTDFRDRVARAVAARRR